VSGMYADLASRHADKALGEHGACDDGCPVRAHALCIRRAASAINQADAEIDELNGALYGLVAAHHGHVVVESTAKASTAKASRTPLFIDLRHDAPESAS
jgi:hypothetical protein